MDTQTVMAVIVLLVLCVLVGVVIPNANVADALAPVGEGVERFLHYYNQIQ